jgi:hypothetical protein
MVRMKCSIVLLAGMLACSAGVLAQEPSLEQLQKRLNEEKRKQNEASAARRDAEARREKARREAEAERKRHEASSGRLVIESDASCNLRINGENKQALQARQPVTIQVQAGEQLIDCFSAADDTVWVRDKRDVKAGQQVVVTLGLNEQVGRKAAEAEQARKRASVVGGFSDEGGDVLRDTRTGLLWSQSDNGSYINMGDASRYCSGKGGGWRLPTSSELQGIYGSGGGAKTQCGGYRCDVSPLFRLTHVFVWSSEKEGVSQAWFVDLNNGNRNLVAVRNTNSNRALCVRRP